MEEDKRKVPVDPEKLRQVIKTSVAKLGPEVPKERKLELAKIMLKIFEKGMTPMEALEIDTKEVMRMYSYAYRLFGSGNFVQAKEVFKLLLVLDPRHAQFATSLGVCYHKEKSYRDALACYMLGTVLDEKDPVPLLYAYDCFVNLNIEFGAGMMLGNVIARCGNQPQYAKVKQRAELLQKALEDKLAAAPK